jgi:hypothetical protein
MKKFRSLQKLFEVYKVSQELLKVLLKLMKARNSFQSFLKERLNVFENKVPF